MSDEKTVAEMKKDELALYAIAEHGVELDLAKPVKELREFVASLDEKKAGKVADKEDEKKPESSHLKHPVNGRVYPSTPALRARKDLIPCDKNGKSV